MDEVAGEVFEAVFVVGFSCPLGIRAVMKEFSEGLDAGEAVVGNQLDESFLAQGFGSDDNPDVIDLVPSGFDDDVIDLGDGGGEPEGALFGAHAGVAVEGLAGARLGPLALGSDGVGFGSGKAEGNELAFEGVGGHRGVGD